ncbi:hypothetical protein [Dietzia sp.]|uniref:hypothetical protein n=1 Tax=Dietzia sp. TaxID=1871616 RepID=UPI002FDB0C52
MGIDFGTMGKSLLNVLILGLVFGAGLPILFSFGIKSLGYNAVVTADGQHGASPAGKAIATAFFVVVGVIAFLGLLLITEKSIIHYLGFDPIPFDDVKKK